MYNIIKILYNKDNLFKCNTIIDRIARCSVGSFNISFFIENFGLSPSVNQVKLHYITHF